MERSSAYVLDEPEDGGRRLLSNKWHPIPQPIKLQQHCYHLGYVLLNHLQRGIHPHI